MFPSNLHLNIWKMVAYSNKVSISNTGMKIGPSKDISKVVVYHKSPVTPLESGRSHSATQLMESTGGPMKDYLAGQHEQTDKTAFKIPYWLFSHSQQFMSVFEIMKYIV